jgi:predicted phosphate transport protein (TIGR00153 family)
MPFFWRKEVNVEKMMSRYFERSDACFQMFEKAFGVFFDTGQGATFEAAVQKAHEAESAADDMRREIELTLYGKALLPDSRGDLLGLLESFDRLPNMAETVLFALRCQRIELPQDLAPLFKRLVDINLQSYYLCRRAVDALLSNPKVTLHATKAVDEKESESDRVEREIICQVFDSEEHDTGQKLLLKDLILLIGSISDRAETVADRIGIVAIKRQI